MSTVPAQSLEAPALAAEIAAMRVIPGVCGVFGSSSSAWTTRTPRRRQSGLSVAPSMVRVAILIPRWLRSPASASGSTLAFRSSPRSISSSDRPFVSGTSARTNGAPRALKLGARVGYEDTGPIGEHDCLDAVAQVELLEDVGDVRLDRRVADEEALADLGVREA